MFSPRYWCWFIFWIRALGRRHRRRSLWICDRPVYNNKSTENLKFPTVWLERYLGHTLKQMINLKIFQIEKIKSLALPIPPLIPRTPPPPPSTRTYNFQATLGGAPLAELLYKSVACLNILTYVNVGGFHLVKHQKQMNGWGDRVCVCSWGGWVGRRGVGIMAVEPGDAYFRLESHGIFVSWILGTFLFSV